jgi:hypothetical protein
MATKIAKDIAAQEVQGWLDFKKIKEKKQESYKDQIEVLVDAVSEGTLEINSETKTITQNLDFPIGSEMKVSKLEYKPRLTVGEIQSHMGGVKATDADGRITAYVAALTNQPKELIKKLDTEDNSIAQSIAIFFL